MQKKREILFLKKLFDLTQILMEKNYQIRLIFHRKCILLHKFDALIFASDLRMKNARVQSTSLVFYA